MTMSLILKRFYLNLVFIFKKAFLPNGYPYTVSRDYCSYQLWDSVQAFASSIMNNLATQSVFKGVGVGDANATVLAATITWILKDGTSMIGSLVFATVQSTKMDSDSKRWRLFADLINDLAICLDLFSPLLGRSYFTLIQCCSGSLRSLVGIAGGATRAALTQHQAKCNNLADVSAKDNSQERMVNLFALLFSLIIIPIVSDNSIITWTLFVLFTMMHIYANYHAVKSVSMEIFNANRLAIFMDNYFQNSYNIKSGNPKSLSLNSVNRMENVWFFNWFNKHDHYFDGINVHYRIDSDLQQQIMDDWKIVYNDDQKEKRFSISILKDCQNIGILDPNFRLNVCINQISNQKSSQKNSLLIVEILLQIFILKWIALEQNEIMTIDQNQTLKQISQSRDKSFSKQLELSSKFVKDIWPNFIETIDSNGWDLSHLLLPEIVHLSLGPPEEEETSTFEGQKKLN